MHIGFITSEYPHPKIAHAAGIGTSIKNLARALAAKGIRVTVFVYQQATQEVVEDEGVSIHILKTKRFRFLTWYFYRKHIQGYLEDIHFQTPLDIIEAPDWTGITAFMNFKMPLVIRFHGSDAYFCKLDKRKQKLKNYIFEKLALKNAKAFIAPTTYAGVETAKIFKLNKSKVKTIHYGLELKHFENKKPNEYKENTLLYIGTLIRKKGVLELAEIFNKVIEEQPNAELLLIGADAPDVKTGISSTYALMKEILTVKAEAKVKYLGKLPYDKVKTHIKKAHVCTFPSFAETLGMVTIESMALQKPVVNTSLGWAQELIDNGINGYLVHPSNIEEYTKVILKLFQDKILCETIGKAAREKTEAIFNIEKLVKTNITYYKEIIEHGNFSS